MSVHDDMPMPMSAAPANSLWHAAPEDVLAWTELDGDFAVYHRLSGTTHFLNAASKLLIEALRREPMTTAGVADEFAEVMLAGEGETAMQSIADLLHQFEAIGLLTRAR